MTTYSPGVFADMPDATYHAAHDWLSATGIKRLIPPSTPAHFKAAMGGSEHKAAFDLGSAVHKRVLGVGEEIVYIDADSFRSKAAQDQRLAAYLSGKIPLLAADAEVVEAIAANVAAATGDLFTGGQPEVSAFWIDDETGVKCRARFDYLRPGLIVDLKTTAGFADAGEFARAAASLAYYVQEAHYRDGAAATGLDADRFIFVVVEKNAPYAVNVIEFDNPLDRQLGAAMVDRARRIYAECVATDTWPAYPITDKPARADLPSWLFERHGEWCGLISEEIH